MPARNGAGVALLADPVRLRIVARIAERPCRPSTVAADLGLSWPAVSRQLRLLEEAGLIVRRRWPVDNRSVLLFLDPAMQRPIIAWLAGTGVRDAIQSAGGPSLGDGSNLRQQFTEG
jgi:DNA-binding transcriptional ArsR family regulator